MKRVLVITYYWPPTGGSGVQRWVKFAKYLPQSGWQPVIYTPDNPEQLVMDETLASEIPEEVEVLRTRINEPYGTYRKLLGRKAGSEVNPVNSQKKTFARKLSLWARGNLFIPDPRVGWVRPSVEFLTSYLKENPVDVMVTTGPPHSMHLIGRELKRRLGIRWIADFRDPWTEMFYFKHLRLSAFAKSRHAALEKSVLDEADTVISVSPLVRDDFARHTETPVELITNGFDEEDFAEDALPGDGFFNVVHTGLFASDGNPVVLWDILARKCSEDRSFREKLRIRLAGKVDDSIVQSLKDRGLEPNLDLPGYLPHNETVRLQRSASLLLLPLRQEPEYRKVLPGKIFEYIASRKPVLGIGQEDGAAAMLLRETGAGLMYDWERRQSQTDFVDNVWEKFVNGETISNGCDISGLSRRALTERLAELL